MAPEAALTITGLHKSFTRPAVNGLDLTVRRGELYALLGPNGAGKTTTLRMVVGLLEPDSGSIEVFGINRLADPLAAKRVIAWLPDEPMIYDKLTPLEYLAFVSGLWQVPGGIARQRAEELLSVLELEPFAHQRCEGFSRGMRQKVALDEPLTGLDAAIARQVKDILGARIKAGASVILTTHILEVAERLADRIGIIRAGRLVAEGTLDELRPHKRTSATLEDVFLDIVSEPAA
jgi:ABC-2 type transport system ATP-binding protein